jgi:hydrogenase maturation protease
VSSETADSHSPSAEAAPALRVLCLGNDLLGDDALGSVVADQLRPFASDDVDILNTSESGFHLLDHLLGVRHLVVVDTVHSGNAPPGTIYQFRDCDLPLPSGGSPHYVGLCEALALARKLSLPVAKEVIILAVEAVDCVTMGAEMSSPVRSTIPRLVSMVRHMMPPITGRRGSQAPS